MPIAAETANASVRNPFGVTSLSLSSLGLFNRLDKRLAHRPGVIQMAGSMSCVGGRRRGAGFFGSGCRHILHVVPANAGTHNHSHWLLCESRHTASFKTTAAAYGSLLSQERRCREILAKRPHSRGTFCPRLARSSAPMRAWGMPGAQCTRSLVWVEITTRVSHHRSTGITRHSRTRWFTAYIVFSPEFGLFGLRRPWNYFRRLGASVEASGPHDFAVRRRCSRL
jgi:hypothetical protein